VATGKVRLAILPYGDRRRLERLCRYFARPPLVHDRLEVRRDGRLVLRHETG
jgi:hypothetical protein